MDNNEIRKYKEYLLSKSGEVRLEAKQSETAIQKARDILSKLTEEHIVKMNSIGIDISYFNTIDFSRMMTDREYHTQVRTRTTEIFNQISDFIKKGVEYSESQLQS